MLDQLPDLCGAGSGHVGQVCLANLFRVRRRFSEKTFFAEFTAPVPPGFARMVLVDPHDMDSSGIPVLENTRAPRLDHAKRERPQLPGHALAGAAGLCGSCSLRRAARDGQAVRQDHNETRISGARRADVTGVAAWVPSCRGFGIAKILKKRQLHLRQGYPLVHGKKSSVAGEKGS
ncbi:MAG: hypothetical protein WA231_03030 [Methylocella sp.]